MTPSGVLRLRSLTTPNFCYFAQRGANDATQEMSSTTTDAAAIAATEAAPSSVAMEVADKDAQMCASAQPAQLNPLPVHNPPACVCAVRRFVRS